MVGRSVALFPLSLRAVHESHGRQVLPGKRYHSIFAPCVSFRSRLPSCDLLDLNILPVAMLFSRPNLRAAGLVSMI